MENNDKFIDESDKEDDTETASEYTRQRDLVRELEECVKELPPLTNDATRATTCIKSCRRITRVFEFFLKLCSKAANYCFLLVHQKDN